MRSTAICNLKLLTSLSLTTPHVLQQPCPHEHTFSSSICGVHWVHHVYGVLKQSWTSRLALAQMCQTTTV